MNEWERLEKDINGELSGIGIGLGVLGRMRNLFLVDLSVKIRL